MCKAREWLCHIMLSTLEDSNPICKIHLICTSETKVHGTRNITQQKFCFYAFLMHLCLFEFSSSVELLYWLETLFFGS